jgi:hypothetical protein
MFCLCRYEHVDSELGIVTEPEDLPEDLYPFHLVDTSAEGGGPGIKGSCTSFATRTKLGKCRVTGIDKQTDMAINVRYGKRCNSVSSVFKCFIFDLCKQM